MKTFEPWKNIGDRENCIARAPKEEKRNGRK